MGHGECDLPPDRGTGTNRAGGRTYKKCLFGNVFPSAENVRKRKVAIKGRAGEEP